MHCMAVTVLVCPNEIVAKSDSVIFSVFFTIPDASPGKSIPVVFPTFIHGEQEGGDRDTQLQRRRKGREMEL
mgnify:CR=1 FL=1